MKKYDIAKDFELISKVKFPLNEDKLDTYNLLIDLIIPKGMKSNEDLNIEKREILTYDNKEINIYIIEPKESTGKLPCLIYLHGGGFMFKSSTHQYKLAKTYAEEAHCKVIFVDYRLAPQNPYPTPLEDCYSTFKYVLENSNELNIDKEKIAVGGDSAGGNLAACLCFLLRDRLKYKPIYQLLIYPVIDRRQSSKTMKEYIDTPVWDSERNAKMWELYLADKEIENIEYVSPIEADSFENIPDAYVEVA